jgi:hypothetical protein
MDGHPVAAIFFATASVSCTNLAMTNLRTGLMALLVVGSLGGAASAQEPPAPAPTPAPSTTSPTDHPGFEFGLRLGYAIPVGDANGPDAAAMTPADHLSDLVSGAVPVVLEAGYRFNKNLSAGVLFQYGFAMIKDGMTTGCGVNGVSCSGSVTQLGIQGIYRLDVEGAFVPWLGAAVGYEWLGIDLSAGGMSGSVSAKGLEFLTLQGGGEYRIAPQMTIGPFLSLSLGQYDTAETNLGGMSMSMSIANKALHEWLQFGVRGTFNL